MFKISISGKAGFLKLFFIWAAAMGTAALIGAETFKTNAYIDNLSYEPPHAKVLGANTFSVGGPGKNPPAPASGSSAACSVLSGASNLRYFGFYGSSLEGLEPSSSFEEIKDFTNLSWVGSWSREFISSEIEKAHSVGQKVIIDATKIPMVNTYIWDQPHWDDYAAFLKPYYDRGDILGFYMADDGWSATEPEMDSRIAMIKTSFPEAITMGFFMNPYMVLFVPKNFDWIGLEMYGSRWGGWSADWLTTVAQKMSPEQKFVLVPGAFTWSGCYGGSWALLGTQCKFEDKNTYLESIFKYATNNPRVAAIIPFVWQDVPNESLKGARNVPSYKSRLQELGKCFSKSSGAGTVVPSPNPTPAPTNSVSDPSGFGGASDVCGKASMWWFKNGATAYNIYRNTVNNSDTAQKIVSNAAYDSSSTGGYIDTVSGGTYFYWVQNVGASNKVPIYMNSLTVATCQTAAVPAVNGQCGYSNGQALAAAPPANGLCNSGIASAVAGSGPWSWICVGSNSGSNASCSATKQTDSASNFFQPEPVPVPAFPTITLNSPTNQSLKISVTPLRMSSSNTWVYRLDWNRTLNRQGSIYINGLSQVATASQSGSKELTLQASGRIKVEFYSSPAGKGTLLLRKYFTVKSGQ